MPKRLAPPKARIQAPAPQGDSQGAAARKALWASVTEKQWQKDVRDAALVYGWLFFHHWTSMHSADGFPDCVMLRGNRLVVAELKREGREPTEAQLRWLQAFRESGAEAYVWRPSDTEWMHEALK